MYVLFELYNCGLESGWGGRGSEVRRGRRQRKGYGEGEQGRRSEKKREMEGEGAIPAFEIYREKERSVHVCD